MDLTSFMLHTASRLREPLYSWAIAVTNWWKLVRCPERRVEPFGNLHPDKTFYVIEALTEGTGVASWYDRVMGYMLRAEKKGWNPVVADTTDDFGQSWKMYFQNPSSASMDDVLHSRNVIYANPNLTMTYRRLNRRNVERRHKLVKFMLLVPEVEDFVNVRMEKLFADAKSPMIGAYLRGTDYRAAKDWRPVGHFIVPSAEQFAERLEEDCRKWGIDVADGAHFFFVTEEQELLDSLLTRFPKARYVEKERFSGFKHGICLSRQSLPHTGRDENNRLYLLDLYALARCDYLVGPMNSGIQMALNLNGNRYREVDIIDLGTH